MSIQVLHLAFAGQGKMGEPFKTTNHFHPVQQGYSMKLWMNDWGNLGYFSTKNCACIPAFVGCEYPEHSYFEHLGIGGLWIGAKVDTSTRGIGQFRKFVTSADNAVGDVPGHFGEGIGSEMSPLDPLNPWQSASILNLGDTGAISESDYYTAYTDTATIAGLKYHTPLGVKVLQRSYAWAKAIREPLLPIEYYLINLGTKKLKDVYVGFEFGPTSFDLADSDVTRHLVVEGYWPELRTAYVKNPVELEVTPLAMTILGLPKQINMSQFRFRWFDDNTETFGCLLDCDTTKYDYMSGEAFPSEGSIRPNQSTTNPISASFLFSFGPVPSWQVGETLKVAVGIESGHSLEFSGDNLKDNARSLLTLYERHYHPPLVLPSPIVQVEKGDRRTLLHWGSSGSTVNPMDVWDDDNAIASYYPPDHWRRINPPPGHTTGGRVFEGYRLYRSEDPSGAPNSFTLLKQWDMVDSVGPKFEFDTGIETTYVDSNLQTGKTYWYSVTSFGIPDLHVIDYLDLDGVVKKETLNTKSAESSVVASRKRVNLSFSISQKAGEVKVVPNPYRTDANYTFESGGWEGRGSAWTENKRLIKFIHLPATCTLRIYSLVGDVIATIYHDDPATGEESWNLLSESNRAVASGVYIFSVESNLGMQVGKFVVIR